MSARRSRGRRQALSTLLDRLGIFPGQEILEPLVRYAELLEKWGARINLTASSEWRTLGPLFEEALWAGLRYPEGPVLHLDVGTGGGFPALPLRILRTDMKLVMVEPSVKRAVFLETVVQELELARSEVHTERVEQFLARDLRLWDIVSWKAVRLSAKAVGGVTAHLAVDGELWLFHGREVPVDDPEALDLGYELLVRERVPARDHAVLSRYRVRGRERLVRK